MDNGSLVEKKAAEVKKQLQERLFKQKYYRSVNIDMTMEEETVAANAKNKKEENGENGAAASTEDYKALLKGMGFNVD